jgi:pimeloyl-ACP methyl ester carboxylesterase
MTGPVHRDVTASGVRLRVVEDGDGPPIVFVHGMFVDSRCWDAVRGELSGSFRVITPDLPGFGQSEKPPPSRFPYGIDAFAEGIADLFAGLELGRSALVGHGLGGAVAMTLAASHPELVSHLVLIGPLSYGERPRLESSLARLPVVGNLLFKQFVGRNLFRAYFRERLLAPGASVSNERIDGFYESFNSPAARGSALATLRSCADARTVVARTSRVQSPTLILWGRGDSLYPPSYGPLLAREIRGAHFDLLDAGHLPQEERPDEVAFHIKRFLVPHSSRRMR